MPNIVVQKVRETEALPRPLLDEIESLSEKIRQRAYALFAMRGGIAGQELDDWLQAEKETMWQPGTELKEKEAEFLARIQLPDLEAKDILIVALPNAILLAAHAATGNEPKRIYRLELPLKIDPDRVMARLDHGLLQIMAPKIKQAALAA